MNNEFIEALDHIERERGISKQILLEAIESALILAYKKNYGTVTEVRVSIDPETGEVNVYSCREVVETVEDDQTQVSLEEAKSMKRTYKLGDIVEELVTPKQFGRIAAQTAKGVVSQRLKDAERNVIYDEFVEKEYEVVSAVIRRIEKNNIYLELGKTEGVMMPSEQVQGENYQINMRLKVYIIEVRKTSKGPQVMVSRTHPGLVKRLFELEVPEIQTGVVLIKSIAREAGFRTKISVLSNDPQVDPVGSCVGQRGIRVENIVQELFGEKIDIIKWSSDPGEYIANALSPARVVMVHVNEVENAAKVIVPDNQLSLAIGKEGQNARLAAKLTGWKIDIKSQSQAAEMFMEIDL